MWFRHEEHHSLPSAVKMAGECSTRIRNKHTIPIAESKRTINLNHRIHNLIKIQSVLSRWSADGRGRAILQCFWRTMHSVNQRLCSKCACVCVCLCSSGMCEWYEGVVNVKGPSWSRHSQDFPRTLCRSRKSSKQVGTGEGPAGSDYLIRFINENHRFKRKMSQVKGM